jgi:hypothetical protein
VAEVAEDKQIEHEIATVERTAGRTTQPLDLGTGPRGDQEAFWYRVFSVARMANPNLLSWVDRPSAGTADEETR